MAQQGVRFARIHGRIVPIRSGKGGDKPAKRKGYMGDKHKDYGHTAALGAGAGVSSALAMRLSHSRSKFGQALGAVAGGVGFGLGLGASVKTIVRTVQQKKGRRVDTFFGHYVSGVLGQFGALTAAGLGYHALRKLARR